MRYSVIIHKDPDSDYGVTVPELPGCFSAGESIEEALGMAKDAILTHIEGWRIDGENVSHLKPTVEDVAAYILENRGLMTAMKLQTLVYYSQAWSLVWDEEPLFDQRIEAWSFSPVVPALYEIHRGCFKVSEVPGGNSANLSSGQADTIDKVLEYYGDKSSHWLSELAHQEAPWQQARKGLKPGERGSREITLSAMVEYYSSLV